MAGTPIALGPTAAYAVVGTSTVPLQGNLDNIITFASSAYTATAGSFTIAGQTLTPGGTITVSGTRISLSPSSPATPYAVIGSSTIRLAPATIGPDVLTVGGQVYTANLLTDFVIAGQILTPGGKITVNGTPVSLASGATEAVVGTSTVGIGGYIMNGFNGGGGSNDGGNGSVVRFLGAGEGWNHLSEWALRAAWLSFGVVLGVVEILKIQRKLQSGTSVCTKVTVSGDDGMQPTASAKSLKRSFLYNNPSRRTRYHSTKINA